MEGLRTSKNPPTKDEIGHLEKAMVDVKKVLQSVYGDLVNLRGGTHGVVDVERHRTAELTVRLYNNETAMVYITLII